ncbi:hypothetical protein ACJRO7_000324 [Eucalyptus globulus]|uniref:MLO-like protein n=1 Tax=Eucalyptus globulus TaxID=34317 RepID=A0ABD3LM80_EUCGL
MAGGAEGPTLEFTPTWVLAVVCTVIVVISLAAERFLHYAGKYLKKRNQKPLFDALQKIKEELMLLGFISLLLAVFQDRIGEICIPEELADKWLPCEKNATDEKNAPDKHSSTTAHFLTNFFPPGGRRLLAEDSAASSDYCSDKKVPLLSQTALHHLHIFIFVLAAVHVVFCALTILCGGAQIRLWKRWEDAIQKEEFDSEEALRTKFTNVQEHTFIRGRFLGIGKNLSILSWVHSFIKQFYGSVTRSDYTTLRFGFIMAHCRGNPKFNFHKYMIRALEADFKKVVGISWYLWLFVVVFLLLNVAGWHAYFWISFIPLTLLLAVGTKLEHVITRLAQDVAQRHIAVAGDLVVKPSDDHFWFHRPRLILILIHIILFQNSFELAFLLFIWIRYKFKSCLMHEVHFIVPRLVIGVFVQLLCSYSTLPLYAIVTQMGTSFKKAIFDEHIQQGLVGWAQKAKNNNNLRKTATDGSSVQTGSKQGLVGVELTKNGGDRTATGDVEALEIKRSSSPTSSKMQTLAKTWS